MELPVSVSSSLQTVNPTHGKRFGRMGTLQCIFWKHLSLHSLGSACGVHGSLSLEIQAQVLKSQAGENASLTTRVQKTAEKKCKKKECIGYSQCREKALLVTHHSRCC